MDKNARVSKDLLEPGPTTLEPEAVPVTTGMIVKNGLRCSCDLEVDYSTINGLEPDKGQMIMLQQLTYLETIPPPSRDCIQLHRLKKGQNIAHLLVLYHHFGASAVIFVNTSNDYELQPELMATLAVVKKNPPRGINCILISRGDGKRLIEKSDGFQYVYCGISFSSCTDELYIVPDHYPVTQKSKFGSLLRSKSHDYTEEPMQKILKLVKHDVIISHTDFEDVMRACEQIENPSARIDNLMEIDHVLLLLLQPTRFGSLFQCDFLFYVALAHRILTASNMYSFDEELLKLFCKICIEGLCDTRPKTLLKPLDSFITRNMFQTLLVKKHYSIRDLLGHAFLNLCSSWVVMDKKSIPSRYWDIAMLCISFTQRLFLNPKDHDVWKHHIANEKISYRMSLEDEDFYYLKKGLKYMAHLRVSRQNAFTPAHFTDFLLSGSVIRPLSCIKRLVFCFSKMNTDCWENHLKNFLIKTAEMYNSFLSTKHPKYAAVATLDGIYGVFQEGWYFIVKTIEILEERNCYNSLAKECSRWMSVLLFIIDFNSADGLQCIKFFVVGINHLPESLVTHSIKELNTKFFECCQKLHVEQFQPIFSAASFWEPKILQSYLKSYYPQSNIVICNDMWQQLLQAASDSPLQCSKIVIELLNRVGKQYSKSKQSEYFIIHLIRLNTPKLLLGCESEVSLEFIKYLRSYIKVLKLRGVLLQKYIYIIEYTSLQANSFMMLVLSATMEEIFFEVAKDNYQVLQDIIVPEMFQQLSDLLKAANYASVRAKCVFGTLQKISSHVHVAKEDLSWLVDCKRVQLLIELCRCFQVVSKHISHSHGTDLDADIAEFLEEVNSREFEGFMSFCQGLQSTLQMWKQKVMDQNVIFSDIMNLKQNLKWFNLMCNAALVSSACIEKSEVEQLAVTYEQIEVQLGDILLQQIPKQPNRCYLSDVLERLGVTLPSDTENKIAKLVIFSSMLVYQPLPASSKFELHKQASIPELNDLLTNLRTFVQPLADNLKTVGFFHVQNSKLFFKYTSHFMATIMEKQPFSPSQRLTTTRILVRGDHCKNIKYAAASVESTLALLNDMCMGTATRDEVTLNGVISLSDTETVKSELNLFADFASSDLSQNLFGTFDGLKGLLCFAELDAINKYITTITDVLRQFELQTCLESEEYNVLKEAATVLTDKGSMTLNLASQTLQKLKHALHLDPESQSSDLTRFRLFESVQRCAHFYRFAEKSNFTGPTGKRSFIDQYRIVAAQVQHEDLNQAILHHLYGSYDYIAPFFDKLVTFSHLMTAIMNLSNLDKGIEHLETVSRNIVLIKMWFRKVEGETTENIEKNLEAILKSGICMFFTCNSGNSVEFQLVYNPYSSRKSFVETAAGLSPVKSEYEKWSLEQMNEFSLKLGFVQCEQQGSELLKRVIYYQQVFKYSGDLLDSYQELKALGHPDYQNIDMKLRSTLFDNALENEVISAKKVLEKWKEDTKKYRQKHVELAFFSNVKVMRILRIIQKEQPAEDLVKEIDFLFACDSKITKRLTVIVKKHLQSLASTVSSSKLPVEIVGPFLHKVIMEKSDQEPVSILVSLSSMKLEMSLQIDSRFMLHSVHGFTPEQMLELIFTVFQCVPKSFQLFKCSTSTTKQQLELFFNRIEQWKAIQYLIIGVDCLSNELQEMLVQKCSDLRDTESEETKVDFIECCQSVLRLMPSVSIYEYRDSSRLSEYPIIHGLLKESCVLNRFLKVYLVSGLAGDGKTHHIRKEMKTHFSNSAVFSLNESFDPSHVIEQLQNLSAKPGLKTALHLNFTFVLPASSESVQEKEQYRFVADQISWFFINLFLFGYVEDACTGVSFRLPSDAEWTVYVEIPCIDNNVSHSLETFVTTYPAFKMLGEAEIIGSSQPYDINHRVQLVCKYLKARKEDKLNKLAQQKKGKLIGVKIGKVPNLTDEECRQLLDEFMPDHIARKITTKLYLRYMFRRCQFLEESPYLQFNVGFGILKPGQQQATDTSKLRSVLFETMLDEVSDFCQHYDQSKGHRKSHYHQLVYDFRQEGDGNFSLLSEALDGNKEQEKFVDFGFDLPSSLQLRMRKTLDKLVSMALGVPYNEATGHIDLLDKKEYVMTLDYAVKMLTIHERRLCGVPVVIKGESGVGKTFLLETLSSLWNHALLADLELKRSRLKDALNDDLSEAINSTSYASKAKEIDDALNNEVMSIDTLKFIINLKPPHLPKYVEKLLLLRTTSVLSILELPTCIEEVDNYSELFERAENASKSRSREPLLKATVQLLYSILYGKLPETFHKISVNAALMPSDIMKLFRPILEQANLILERSRSLWGTESIMDDLKLPVVTVFLDEINTSSCLGVLKEIVVDGTLDGKEIPRNVFIVAACNPYRGNSLASLKSGSWFRGSYYVRPLHPTLELLMWDYKALDPVQEREYVFAKMSLKKSEFTQSLMNSKSDNVDNSSLTDQIVKSQELVRQYAFESLIKGMRSGKELEVADKEEARVHASSTVSQRDIQRVFGFYSWLQKMFRAAERYAKESNMKVNLRAVYVSLALVYYFRLDSECRAKYLKEMNTSSVFTFDKEPVTFSEAVQNELDWLLQNITLPPGVAATEALKENLYSIVICTMTRTPLIILGPPGSSKTLSFKIVISNLQGMASVNGVFRNSDVFHALEPTFYQCSRRSTSTEIDTMFETAIKNQKFYDSHGQNSYSVVLMDEAGLPEESHESLKVLHVHLDRRAVSFVAISNHVLDAAKTNRAVSLFRPETSKEDVIKLAEGCLKEHFNFTEGMCQIYLSKMKIPEFRAFYGLRDFVHFFTCLHHYDIKSPQAVLKALERNFNGSCHFKDLCECFLHKMGSSLAQVEQRSVLAILKDSLLDKHKDLSAENEVRYKLIIDSSGDESIIRFLFSFGILQRDKTRVYICSKFPGDGEAQKINTIGAIRHSAVLGHTVILSQTDEIHETFYDLFNQRFTCIDHPEHGKLFFTNIAIGPHVKPSKVDPHFQCVVVIKKSEQHCTPAPFLNRFEKYALSHQILLQDVLDSYPKQLRLLIDAAIEKVEKFLNVFGVSGLYGQNESTLQSLLLTVLPVYSSDCELTYSKTCIDSKEKLLRCLLSVIKGRLNMSFPNVTADLSSAADHVSSVLMKDSDFFGILQNLCDQPISSSIIDEAVDYLVNNSDVQQASTTPTVACQMVITFLLQWLVTYLCERLIQLMTPETLIINHKKIPSYYMNIYLNQQHHFKLIELINDYHSALLCKDTIRSVPNKILCFSRSSSLIHSSIFDEFPNEAKTVASDLERLVFSYPYVEEGCLRELELRLRVIKVTTSTTQGSISSKLQIFCKHETCEVMVFVVNMQYSSVKIVNHLRIMIEEAEVQYPKVADIPKLFVMFLHFPPEMFFNHCYPSLFLSGWDHYYLDTIAPSEENGVIDISQWFSNFCISKNHDSSNFLLEPLRKLMEKAIPVLATRFSVANNEQLPDRDQHSANLSDLKTILLETQLGSILRKQFASYWQASEMAEFSEQAANFPHMYESTLSITDAIHTIVRSSFYDFLFYILSVLKRQSVLIQLLKADKSDFQDISLELVEHFPKPKTLSHLKIASMSEVRVFLNEEQLISTKFPFFHFICGLLKKLLDQCEKDVHVLTNESDVENSMDSQPMSLGLRQSVNSSPREALCNKAEEKLREASTAGNQSFNHSLSQKEDLKFLQVALTKMGQDSKRWTAYLDDFMAIKFNLYTCSKSPSMQMLHRLFSELEEIEIQRRAIELHAYIKLSKFDSNFLDLLRYVDNLYQDSAVSFQPAAGESMNYFDNLNLLLELVTNSLYNSLHKFLSEPDRLNIPALKNLSGYFYTLISNPELSNTVDGISCREKARLQVLYATFLMLFSEVENTAKSTMVFFGKLDVLLSKKGDAGKLTLEEVVVAVAQTIVDTDTSMDTIVEALTLPYNASFHYMLEGLLEYFLCTRSSIDITWFLKLANSSAVVQSITSSQQRTTLSAHAMKYHLMMLLTDGNLSGDVLERIFSSELRCTLEEYLSNCVPRSDTGEPVCVPVHYHNIGSTIERSCPLLHIYCNLLLEVLRNRNMTLPDIIRLYGRMSDGSVVQEDLPMTGEVILRTAGQQAMVQYLIEKLSISLAAKEYNVVQLAEICEDVNRMLAHPGDDFEGHGLMLALQMLREYGSSRAFIEAMAAKNGVYTDFECLRPIHENLESQKEATAAKVCLKESFPFNMMSGNKTDEQELYGRIKKALINLHRAPKRKGYNDTLQRLIGECYSEGALISSGRKKKHIFNMLMWLCIYYEFYYCEKSCSDFANALKENFSLYNVEPTFLALMLMFANSQYASWNQQPPVAIPKTICELFRSKDVSNVELRDTLAHLVAAVLGSCEKPCHLNHHLFYPQELLKTLIPGAMVQVAIGVDISYDKATELVEGSLPGLQQVASMRTHTMSLQCYYFTLWANYGALCMDQLLKPTAKDLLGKVFPQDFSLLQYCFERMVEFWNMLSTHLCLTTENRFILVNNVLERVYKHDFETNQIGSSMILDQYQKEWNEVFVCGWVTSKEQELQKSLLPRPIGDKLSQLDRRSPVFASIPRFLLQLFSSTYLDNKSCHLYVLYQFILKRPRLNAGGILLPDLVKIYLWLHNELNYKLSLDVAKTVTVGEMRLYLDRKLLVGEQRSKIIGLVNTVKAKYQEYRNIEGCSELPELTFETPLIDLLSKPDKHGILYKVMLHIVNSYNTFLKDIKQHSDRMLVERYMKEDFSKKSLFVPLVEVNESTCCFGSALSFRLDDLDDMLPLISKCCSMVAFRQMDGPLVTIDSTLLPCCVPQQFDLACLQDDIAKSFIVGKRLLQMPEGIHVMFQFKEQSRGQPITGNFSQGALFQMAALENLEQSLKETLDVNVTRRTEYECHSMKYYTLLEVTIGLRNAVGYLVKDGFQITRDMETLSNLVKDNTATGNLSDLGIQHTSLTSSQSHFLLEMKLIHVYKTLELLLEWLELGMYDFCSLPFAMKAHLHVTAEDKQTLADTVKKQDVGQVLQDLKSLQTVLVQADSKLRQSAVNGKINAPLIEVLCGEDCPLLKTYLTNSILVCHYVHLRLELRRLFKQVQNSTDVETSSQMLSDDEKWNDKVDDLWTKLKCIEEQPITTAFHLDEDSASAHVDYFGFERWIDETLDASLLGLKKERQEARLEEQQDGAVKSEDDEAAKDEQTISVESIDFQEHIDEKLLIATARKHNPAVLADFLKTIGFDSYAENVIDCEVSGDMLVGPKGMDVLKELEMTPIEQLRVHFLYRQHLLGRRSRLAEQCPVGKVVQFFNKHKVLREKIHMIEQNEIDGEMLLQASEEAIEELGITSIGWKLILKDLIKYSCS